MKRWTGNLVLLFTSICVSLFLAELVVRFTMPQPLSGSWRVESSTGNYRLNKDSGASRHQFRDRVVTYQFGEHHLRTGPAGRPSAPYEILALGDSFTFGWLLNWEDTFVARLQALADDSFGPDRIAFLNAAAGGWGTADYVAYYEDHGEELDPDLVLVFLNTDDIGRILRSGIYELSASSGRLERLPPAEPNRLKALANALPGYQYLLERSHLVQVVRLVAMDATRPVQQDGPWQTTAAPTPRSVATEAGAAASTELAKALFLHLSRLARARGDELVVLTTGWHRFGSAPPNDPTAAFMSTAESFFAENGIPFFDISDAVHEASGGDVESVVIAHDGHPNARGARLIADAAWPVLSEYLDENVPSRLGKESVLGNGSAQVTGAGGRGRP